MSRIILIAVFFILQAVLPAQAVADDVTEQLRAKITKLFPTERDFRISATPVRGLYEVDFGNSFMYISADGQYALQGDIIAVDTNVNLTEAKRSAVRLANVNAIGEENMIIYPAKNKRYTITVFTDIDCAFCRKFHKQINEYTSRGIEVRYLFNPLAGLGSVSYYKAVSVWCADDRRKALTMAKLGRPLERRNCDNPVQQHMKVAKTVGARSTPTILFEDGLLNPGYISPERLTRILDLRSQVAKN